MKYWKGKENTNKAGQYGTMDNTGLVPDSISISKFQYDQHIQALPIVIHEDSDIEKLIKWAKKEGHIS